MPTRKPKRGRNGGARPGAGRPKGDGVNLQAYAPRALVEQADAAARVTGVTRSRYIVIAVERSIGELEADAIRASADEGIITAEECDSLLGATTPR